MWLCICSLIPTLSSLKALLISTNNTVEGKPRLCTSLYGCGAKQPWPRETVVSGGVCGGRKKGPCLFNTHLSLKWTMETMAGYRPQKFSRGTLPVPLTQAIGSLVWTAVHQTAALTLLATLCCPLHLTASSSLMGFHSPSHLTSGSSLHGVPFTCLSHKCWGPGRFRDSILS